jgi:lysophospholipase L1-like esterase
MKARTQARGAEDMLSADGFHLNDFGYRCMAEHIATAILSRLPTSRATTVKR